MKRLIIALLSCFVALSSPAQVLMGDMNKDGEINVGDLTTLVNVILGTHDKEYITAASLSDNTELLGLWYASATDILNFDATGSCTGLEAAKYLLVDRALLTYNASDELIGAYRIGELNAERLRLTAVGSSTSVTYYRELPTFEEHEYVDLGLSVKWATCNVGASTPEEYGEYYAWGEIAPKTAYLWSDYLWSTEASSSNLKKYNDTDKKTVLDPEDDAAHVNWGGDWRMPTRQEIDELRTNCTWEVTTQKGVNGYKVTGTNGNYIFLPNAGYMANSVLCYVHSGGRYWSSTLFAGDSAFYLYFGSGTVDRYEDYRYVGRSIRPVCP